MNIQSVEKFIFTKLLENGGAFANDTKSLSAWDQPVILPHTNRNHAQ
jgi:hypothetical protein